jgi:hypothetical protein
MRSAFVPLCYVPGFSSSKFCAFSNPPATSVKWADYPKLVNVQSASFEKLLDELVLGSGMALEIRKAELATSDLIVLVKFSQLTSRSMIADSLRDFVVDARTASRGLQKLSSKVGGAVDG